MQSRFTPRAGYAPCSKPVFFLALFLILANSLSAQAPTALQYPGVNVYKANVDNVYLAPTVSGNITQYSISPAVPAGLSFSTATGIISGRFSGASAVTTYAVTATNAYGNATTSFSMQAFNYYYDNANAQVSFLAANATPKVYVSLATAGETQGDIVLYSNVTTIAGTAIDCIVTTRTITNVSSWTAYDQQAASGSSFNSNDDHFFSPQVSFGTGGGSIIFDFQFILGGTFDNTLHTGTNVVLQNVKLNTYDIDGNGSAIQYNEFGGFSTSELGTSTNEVVSFTTATGLTRYTSNTSANTVAVTDPLNRIRVGYNEMSNFAISVGATGLGLAYYFLDFSSGPAFTTVSTPAPSLDLNTSLIGVNNAGSACGAAFAFTAPLQTTAAANTNLVEFSLRVPTASILDGANEKLILPNATSGSSIALNFANATAIPNVVFSTITYSVTAAVSGGISTLTFARSSGTNQFTLAEAETLVDQLQYQNVSASPTNGLRTFTLNTRNTLFKSPDAIFTATLNCVALSGNIYHDANALTDNTVNANSSTGQFADNSLYAVLVDAATGLVLKSQGIAGSAYNFGNASPGKYNVLFSTSVPGNGTAFATSILPTGNYYSTGENLGSGVGNDLLVDGKVVLSLGSVSATNVNFGLQIPPVATGVAETSSLNPGGFNYKTITGTKFGATDADGTVSSITITSFPTNANTLKIGSTVYIPTGGTCPPQSNCTVWSGPVTVPFSSGAPSSSIAVDPIDGNTTVTINYTATDNGNAISAPSSIAVPFTVPGLPIIVAGVVWNDGDGNGLITGGEAMTNAANSGETLYALLVQNTNTYSTAPTILMSTPVDAVSGFVFNNVPAGNDYGVRIVSSAVSPVDGAASSTLGAALAAGYMGVSTNNSGLVTTALNTAALLNTIPALASNKFNVNFGIERAPTANGGTYTIAQPSANTTLALLPVNGLGILAGNDAEDGAKGSGSSIKIISLAGMNGNTLKYLGVPVTANTVIPAYNPNSLSVLFSGTGSLSASFTFVFIDNAGVPGITPATYLINWPSVLAVSLIDFEAQPINKAAKLSWKVADETEVAKFVIERSADGSAWADIITQQANGSLNYSVTDPAPLKGANFYRLMIMDNSGNKKYSTAKKLIFGGSDLNVTVAPNPVVDRVTVTTDNNVLGHVDVLNSRGQIVLSNSLQHSATLDMQRLSAGTYFIRVTDWDNNVQTVTVFKK